MASPPQLTSTSSLAWANDMVERSATGTAAAAPAAEMKARRLKMPCSAALNKDNRYSLLMTYSSLRSSPPDASGKAKACSSDHVTHNSCPGSSEESSFELRISSDSGRPDADASCRTEFAPP